MGGMSILNKNKVIEALNIPKEAVTSIPNIIIKGLEEIVIENHKGVKYLSDTRIEFNSSVGIIRVDGKDLEIKYISSLTIVLNGTFKGIRYVEDKE